MRQIAAVAIVVVMALTVSVSAQQAAPSPDSLQKLMATYMELAQPGPEHQLLNDMAGKWNMELTMWPQPGAEPMKSNLTGEFNLILGGRFLQSTSKGKIFGMDSETMQILGFDRRSKKYTLVAFDTQGTYSVSASGTMDPKTSTMTLYGEDVDPLMNMVQKYDFVIKVIDKDTHSWSIIFKNPEMTGGAAEFKMIEILCKRAK
ncbi:MAG: DUF1579 domain-containing protein [bacterium]|nr:DUF1579 domain-containing protein [bacterium]